MSGSDLRTPIIYILTCIIVVLLIILKKMDDQNKEQTLEKRMEQLETKVENVKKAQKINEASRVLMCRIAALLPEEKHGCFSGDPSISTYQTENGLDSV